MCEVRSDPTQLFIIPHLNRQAFKYSELHTEGQDWSGTNNHETPYNVDLQKHNEIMVKCL